jgi:hypothetical protein
MMVALISATTVVAATGVWIAVAETSQGPVFIAGDKPVSEGQIRDKLEADGYVNVLILRQRRTFEAMAARDGKVAKFLVNAATGRLVTVDDDDD